MMKCDRLGCEELGCIIVNVFGEDYYVCPLHEVELLCGGIET